MSLYNTLFGGPNPATEVVLQTLGLTPADIPRFRDVYLAEGCIVIHTRTGGGNRSFYDEPNLNNPNGPWNSTLRANPHYLRDEDADFDSTYADFYFKYPEGYEEAYQQLAKSPMGITPADRWKQLFGGLKG